MKTDKSMKFAGRISFKPKHRGPMTSARPSSGVGMTAGEKVMGRAKMCAPLKATAYPHSQSSDGNGGK